MVLIETAMEILQNNVQLEPIVGYMEELRKQRNNSVQVLFQSFLLNTMIVSDRTPVLVRASGPFAVHQTEGLRRSTGLSIPGCIHQRLHQAHDWILRQILMFKIFLCLSCHKNDASLFYNILWISEQNLIYSYIHTMLLLLLLLLV